MATLQAKNNPQSRIDAGDRILHAAKTVDTRAIKSKLAAFAKSHAAYVAAHKAALVAEEKLDDAQAGVGEADGVQDAAVLLLAAKMIGDGAPKANPLSIFKLPPPSKLVDLAVEAEVKKTKQLAKQTARWPRATARTKAAAAKLGKAAVAVEGALKRVPPLQKGYAAAIAKREALAIPWTRALVHLKNAARVAEDDGSRGVFAALFEVPSTRSAARAPQAPPNGGGVVSAAPASSAS